jgi:isocitrate dehydrogenase
MAGLNRSNHLRITAMTPDDAFVPATSLVPTLNPSATKVAITIAEGDGIGPEIMRAVLAILNAAGARLDYETIRIGESQYLSGHSSGIAPEAWDSLRRTRVFLKAPITTPQGGGYKSLNVTIRKTLGLYANVRPAVAYAPFVPTAHPKMDLVVIRENEEDLYAGIEHRQTDEVFQCLKLITRPGCEKIVRYAFEYAAAHGRKKVTCMSKDNIMKMTDGLFHQVFDAIAKEYPQNKTDHQIIDIGTARVATQPERYDVIVTTNLYGDILSDVAAEVAGSVGLAGSANIGEHVAMFEAIHGSAPDIAGRDMANPSGLLQAAIMMLVHVGQSDVANRIQNAWLATLEAGIHTADFHRDEAGAPVGCQAFAAAVIERLGHTPKHFPLAAYAPLSAKPAVKVATPKPRADKRLVGVDVFVHAVMSPDALAEKIAGAAAGPLQLKMITNRGVKVWPQGMPETFCTDHWRCRFMTAADGGSISHRDIVELTRSLVEQDVDFIKTENLCTFDGERGFALGQGQ